MKRLLWFICALIATAFGYWFAYEWGRTVQETHDLKIIKDQGREWYDQSAAARRLGEKKNAAFYLDKSIAAFWLETKIERSIYDDSKRPAKSGS